jgi:hypothetical protein
MKPEPSLHHVPAHQVESSNTAKSAPSRVALVAGHVLVVKTRHSNLAPTEGFPTGAILEK